MSLSLSCGQKGRIAERLEAWGQVQQCGVGSPGLISAEIVGALWCPGTLLLWPQGPGLGSRAKGELSQVGVEA